LLLSVFALCLQLIAPALHSSLHPDSRTANGDLFALLGEYAAGVAVSFEIARIAFLPTTYPVVVPAHRSGTFSARAPPVST